MRQLRSYCKLLTIILVLTSLAAFEGRANSGDKPIDPALHPESMYWYEQGIKKHAWLALDEIAGLRLSGAATSMKETDLLQLVHPRALITQKSDFIVSFKLPAPLSKGDLRRRMSSIRRFNIFRQACPVLYTSPDKAPGSRLVLTAQIIVQFPRAYTQEQIAALEEEYGLERLKTFDFAPNTHLYQGSDPLTSIDMANQLSESGRVSFAYPNWLRTRVTRAIPNDALFPNQWHLNNTGQGNGTPGEDVNITAVWDTFQGSADEVIAIVDDGLEIGHEDLAANVLANQSWDYLGNDPDPTGGAHGTSCGGVAAARGFNLIGVSGAAPLAGLVGFRLLGADTDTNEADALTRSNGLIDIYSNSWGPADDGRRLAGPGPLTESALQSGVANGRGGLGSIFVWAGGNGYDTDNANYDGYANSRYTIAVAASTNSGVRSAYSEKGANILLNSPSNGGTLDITTVDRTGTDGYDPGNYTGTFGGTSSAAPLVSGIIALMIEANANLSWRDIQHILIETAEKNDPTDADWTTNAAGYPINHKYGFGRIDALAAVSAAFNWASAGNEVTTQGSSSPNLPVPDNNTTGVQDTITIAGNIDIEFVEIYFTAADHPYWGDLEITLTSPSGTQSVLSENHISGRNTAFYNN
ncbi:MAG: S8 family serine peptidase, partial [Deltaproteobacteria bacterium]|nr:S8 family serine peptidase [Deltaproteobacteria bacterium]